MLTANYVGQATRYRVALDQGGEVTVTRQNLETSHEQARRLDGQPVRLGWREQQTFDLKTAAATHPEEGA